MDNLRSLHMCSTLPAAHTGSPLPASYTQNEKFIAVFLQFLIITLLLALSVSSSENEFLLIYDRRRRI